MAKEEKKTAQNLVDYINNNAICEIKNGLIEINRNVIQIDIANNEFSVSNLNGNDHKRIFDLTKFENHSVVMLLIELFQKGYSAQNIYLEKSWASGRSTSDYLDVMLSNPKTQDIIMFEVKTFSALKSDYSDTSKEKNMMQLISYIMHQPKNTKIATFYAYDFDNVRPVFNNIYCDLLS